MVCGMNRSQEEDACLVYALSRISSVHPLWTCLRPVSRHAHHRLEQQTPWCILNLLGAASLSLPPALAACCAAQVSPAAVWGGRRGGQRRTFPEHRARPARPRPRGRLLCAGPCASLLLPSRPPFLLVSEAIEF